MTRSRPWRRLLVFDVLLLAFLVLGTRLATILHELLGHALTALASGGAVNGVYVSLLGGGRVLHDLPDGSGVPVRFLVACSGIAVNLLTGALVLQRFGRRPRGRLIEGFWIVFAGTSLLGGAAYAALGFYYGQGDPVAWMERGTSQAAWACLPFLAAAPFLGYAATRAFSAWAAHWFPAATFNGRLLVLMATAGITAAAYAGLYKTAGARSRALDAPRAAHEEARKQLVRAKQEALARRLSALRPDLTKDEIRRIVQQTPVLVRPDELTWRIPLKPVLAVLFAAGGFAALRRSPPPAGARKHLRPGPVILTTTLAAGVFAVLFTTGGWIYRAAGL